MEPTRLQTFSAGSKMIGNAPFLLGTACLPPHAGSARTGFSPEVFAREVMLEGLGQGE